MAHQLTNNGPRFFGRKIHSKQIFPVGRNDRPLKIYHKVASSNTSRLEAHAGFFRLLMNEGDKTSGKSYIINKKVVTSVVNKTASIHHWGA